MAQKKTGSKRTQRRATPLSKHQRFKKTLHAPFSGLRLPLQFVDWHRERLPEFLWIHYILSHYGIGVFSAIMDYLDQYADPQEEPLLGTISSFGLIPEKNRDAVNSKMPDNFRTVFGEWTHIAKLYPNMPGNWLFLSEGLGEHSRPLDESLAALKSMVRELFDGKSSRASMPRAAAFSRIIKHRKFISYDKEFVESLFAYPQKDEEQRGLTESKIRVATGNLLLGRHEMGEWSKYFWRQNFRISVCEKPNPVLTAQPQSGRYSLRSVLEHAKEFERAQAMSLEAVLQQVSIDLYDLKRQEVLIGIVARQFRLLCAVLSDVNLWSEDLAAHLLRSMFENLLTAKYLEANPALYPKFVEYGLGQLKLYKLRLQDLEAAQEPPDPELTEFLDQLEAGIDSEQWEERLPIDLGSWSGKPVREMAREVNMEEPYKFLYQPYSIDVHGTWTSLIRWNMMRCRNPLHLFHHIADLHRPDVNFSSILPALDMFEAIVSLVVGALNTPWEKRELLAPLCSLRENLKQVLS